MEKEIIIKDCSGDKKYFTQLPHYILNHSTANDQALYWQMKRYSGENGKCFATQETLRGKLGIGKQAFTKSLNYLLEKKWIKFIGMTAGKTRPIKTYSITDIWKLNINHYEEIGTKMEVSSNKSKKISPETDIDKSQNGSKIGTRMAIEEEHTLRRTNKNNSIDKIDFSLEEIKLTRLLYSLVKENYPFLKDKTEEQLQSDYSEMNKLHRIDGFSYKQIKWIIKWATQDEFWKQNIRSVSKLRKQFNNLIIKAKGEYDKNNKSKTIFI